MLFWLINSVCPALHFNLDFKATIEKQQINTAELLQVIERFCLNGGVSQFESGKLAWKPSKKRIVYVDFTLN